MPAEKLNPIAEEAASPNRTGSQSALNQASNISYMSTFAMKLERNKKLHKFFVSVSDEGNSVKWCKLNRNLFKNHLVERYGRRITERILLFLDT